jgi:hypothetical protein
VTFDLFLDYLKHHIKDFKVVNKGKMRFSCPNLSKHPYKSDIPTAEWISGSEKICCLVCGFKSDAVGIVRLLEPDKATMSEEEILNYLSSTNKKEYPELSVYQKYGFSLVREAKNGRSPFDDGWTKTPKYNIAEWKQWLDKGYNIALMTGEFSKCTSIDFDLYKIKEHTENTRKILEWLESAQTLVQTSRSGGKHYFFTYDPDFKNDQPEGLYLDIKNNGGAITLQPSKIDGKCYEFINLGAEIKPIPKELKEFLLNYKPKRPEVKTVEQDEIQKMEGIKTFGDGDGRNVLITSLGGLFVNRFQPDDTEFIMNVINNKFFNPRLSPSEITASLKSLTGYKQNAELSQGEKVFEYLKEMKDVTPLDTKDSLQLSRAIVDKWLSLFVKKGKAIRIGKGRGVHYQYKEKVDWSDELPENKNNSLPYQVPWFSHIHNFSVSDMMILGGLPGSTKTSCAMNIIKQMSLQGVKVHYIGTEAGSRYNSTCEKLGIKSGDFYRLKNDEEQINPLGIELEPNSFTILDWLDIQDFSETHIIMKHLNDELKKSKGFLVIFTQLKKESYDYFSKNLIDFYAAFAARYIFDDRSQGLGHWVVDKVREAKIAYQDYSSVNMIFNYKTYELNRVENL